MPAGKRFIIVFVVDGLRPDAITAEDTPTLHRLRAEGVDFANSHAVFPTVTRVNAAAIATGTQPGTNGIVGNQIHVPAVDPHRALDTGNFRNLMRVDEVTAGTAPAGPDPGRAPARAGPPARRRQLGLDRQRVPAQSTGAARVSAPSSTGISTRAARWRIHPR